MMETKIHVFKNQKPKHVLAQIKNECQILVRQDLNWQMWFKLYDWALSDWDHLWKLCIGTSTAAGRALHLCPWFLAVKKQTNKKRLSEGLNVELELLPVLPVNWPSGTVASWVKGHWLSGTQQPTKAPMTVCFSARPTVSIQSHSPPPKGRTATPEISLQQNLMWLFSTASAAHVWTRTDLWCHLLLSFSAGTGKGIPCYQWNPKW